MKAFKIFIALLIFFPAYSFAQLLTNSYYSKVVLKRGENRVVGVDSIYIDTLWLGDKASLKCYQHTVLVINHAFIGKVCEINSAGRSGAYGESQNQFKGGDGEDGKNLTLVLKFEELGSLTINTNGGNGGNGANGKAGSNGMPGSMGGNGEGGYSGGNGGNGGNLTIMYSYHGFVPIFNGQSNHNHSIQLLHLGGKSGSGGRGGAGGAGGAAPTRTEYTPGTGTRRMIVEGPAGKSGMRGNPGASGVGGKDGELILKRLD